tara:strand:- start:557 stop:1348 length:792 start_codon:yes stop_codon:yes gene_type:complete
MIKTEIMGILNITPDSFYDGNSNMIHSKNVLEEKLVLLNKASIIDIGCESSRPGSKPISINEELDRLKIINNVNFNNKTLSIDSYKPEVIEHCLNHGFKIVNDISGGGVNFKNINIANKYNSKIILMHMKGSPMNMQNSPRYANVIDEINRFFDERITYCKKIGMSTKNIILDPGIGFGKTIEHNDQILLNLNEFKHFNCKILVGLSRKSFLSVDNDKPKSRLYQSLASGAIASFLGADILRVHDVRETYLMLKIINRFKAYG